MRNRLLMMGVLAAATATAARAATFQFMALGVASTDGTSAGAVGVALIPFSYDTSTNTLTPSPAIAVASSGAAELTLPAQTGNHDGMIRLSGDGNILTFAGYRVASGDTSISNPILTPASAVNRVIGQYNIATGIIDTSQALSNAYNYGSITSAVTQNGDQVWTGGSQGFTSAANTTFDLSGGVQYASSNTVTFTTNIGKIQNATGTPQPDSVRSLLIAGGQLYITTPAQSSYQVLKNGKTYFRGAYQIGDKVPTTGSTVNTYMPVMNDLESTTDMGQEIVFDGKGSYVPKSDLAFADLDPTIPGLDTAYGTGGKQEFEKWTLVPDGAGGGYHWQQDSISIFSGATDINALAISVENSKLIDIFATSDGGIYHFTDTVGYTQTADSGATLLPTPGFIYNAAANGFQLRGLAALPVPEPATLAILCFAGTAMLKRRNRSRA